VPAFTFGQPDDGIIQMAYIVPDIAAAIDRWVTDLGGYKASLVWDGSDPVRPFG
jgi:hypothetical protein